MPLRVKLDAQAKAHETPGFSEVIASQASSDPWPGALRAARSVQISSHVAVPGLNVPPTHIASLPTSA